MLTSICRDRFILLSTRFRQLGKLLGFLLFWDGVCTVIAFVLLNWHFPAPGNLTRVQFYYKSPSRNSIVFKGWVKPRPMRFYPKYPEISSSESSLLEERMPERPPSCSESVTPPRVQRSIGVIQRETANEYVLVLNSTLNLIV